MPRFGILNVKKTDEAQKVARAKVILEAFKANNMAASLLRQLVATNHLTTSQWRHFSDYESRFLASFGEPEVVLPPVVLNIPQAEKPAKSRKRGKKTQDVPPEPPREFCEDLTDIGVYEFETTPTRRALAFARDNGIDLVETSVLSGEISLPFPYLNPVQSEAWKTLERDCNVIVTASTSSGKTLIGVMYLLDALKSGKKAIYLSPLKALSQEKYNEWTDPVKGIPPHYKVVIQTGDYILTDERKRELEEGDLLILTTETLDSRSRHVQPGSFLDNVGVVIVDEAHLIGSEGRGSKAEVALMRFSEFNPSAKILLLSATMPNTEELRGWVESLNGKETVAIQSDFRPVKLNLHTEMQPYNLKAANRPLLFMKTIQILQDHPEDKAIVFCHTKRDLRDMYSALVAAQIPSATHYGNLDKASRQRNERSFKSTDGVRVLVATSTLCMHPDTLITTSQGPTPISQLQEGMKVLTHTGKFQKVLGVSKRFFEGDLLKISAAGMLPVLMTKEHRILRSSRRRTGYHGKFGSWNKWERRPLNWVKAADLQVSTRYLGDEVTSPNEDIPLEGTQKWVNIHDTTFIGRNQFGSSFPHPVAKEVPFQVDLTEQLAELFGLYVAEGCTGRNGVVAFCIATYEEDLTEFISTSLKAFFKTTPKVVDAPRHRRRVHCCSRVLAHFFDTFFGRGAVNKHFPEPLISASPQIIRGLVRGAWWGDGTYSAKTYNTARYTTISPRLAEQMQRMLKRLGFFPAVRISPPRGIGKHPQYHLVLSGAYGARFISQILGVPQEELRGGNRTYNVANLVEGTWRSPVRKVETIPYSGDVFNLHVEGDESYVCSFAFTVHNSAGVNLPARRVIILGVHRGPSKVSRSELMQCIGRCGRAGLDPEGDAHVILPSQADEWHEYLTQPEPVYSQLGTKDALGFHIIAEIRNGCRTYDSLVAWSRRSFSWYQSLIQGKEPSSYLQYLQEVVRDLISMKCISEENGQYKVQPLGHVAVSFYYSPYDCSDWSRNFKTLWRRERQDDAHLAYLIGNCRGYSSVYASKSAIERFPEGASLPDVWDQAKPTITALYEVLQGRRHVLGDLVRFYDVIAADAERLMTAMERIQSISIGQDYIDLPLLCRRLRGGVSAEYSDMLRLRSITPSQARAIYDRFDFATVREIHTHPDTILQAFGAEKGQRILAEAARLVGG